MKIKMNKTLRNYLIGAGVLVALAGGTIKSLERAFYYDQQAISLRENNPDLNEKIFFEQDITYINRPTLFETNFDKLEKIGAEDRIARDSNEYSRIMNEDSISDKIEKYNQTEKRTRIYGAASCLGFVGSVFFSLGYFGCLGDKLKELHNKRKEKAKGEKAK
jgi:hypothetical protein